MLRVVIVGDIQFTKEQVFHVFMTCGICGEHMICVMNKWLAYFKIIEQCASDDSSSYATDANSVYHFEARVVGFALHSGCWPVHANKAHIVQEFAATNQVVSSHCATFALEDMCC